jgi:hypothetical protein
MRDVTSPSIVPEEISDETYAAVVADIHRLAQAKREGDADALTAAVGRFDNVPDLRELVHETANGKTYGEVQGARSRDRTRKYAHRKVARARAYQKRRRDPLYADYSDSNLKALCGQRLVRDPTDSNKDLRTLERRQAITVIDEGLALIATGRFAQSSGNIAPES